MIRSQPPPELSYLAQLICDIGRREEAPFAANMMCALCCEFVRYVKAQWKTDRLAALCLELGKLADDKPLALVQCAQRSHDEVESRIDVKAGDLGPRIWNGLEILEIDPDGGSGKRKLEDGEGEGDGNAGESEGQSKKRPKVKPSNK